MHLIGSPGENGPTPLLHPLPSLAGEGPHRIRRLTDHIVTPVGSRADFFNELLTQDTRSCFKTSSILLQRGLSTRQESRPPPTARPHGGPPGAPLRGAN